MDIIDGKREEFGPEFQEFASLRGKADRLLAKRLVGSRPGEPPLMGRILHR